MQPVIELRDFTCHRGEEPLFQPLSIRLPPGGVLQVVGPNGAGKTTLLRAIAGLYDGFSGVYFWQGKDIAQRHYERAEALLYLGHQAGVKSILSPSENLSWSEGIRGADVAGELNPLAALAQVGLRGYEDTPCFQMSAGQQRRVGLARLYLTSATVWILDEPFTAIDTLGVARLEALLHAHAERGGCVILTSHQAVSLPGLTTVSLQPATGGAA